MTIRDDPNDPAGRPLRDEEARNTAKTATIIAAVAGLIALVALILALVHMSDDFAPANCDPATDYVCEPETVQETTTTDVPSTSMSPTEVPVPTVTPSETVTTTVRP
jgi:hypothetical protein